MSNLIQFVGSILLAFVPVIIWGYIFFQRGRDNRKVSILVFIAGALAVFPILLYKISWQFFPWMNAFRLADNYEHDVIGFSNVMVLPLSIIITFMIVGIIEEVMKLIAVKTVDKKIIRNIDESIEIFIIAALGFSFIENILYFYNIWVTQGGNNLFVPFIFRSSFSTFAHLLFSGVLGYYYGIARFAHPILQEEMKKNKKHWTVLFHKIIPFKEDSIFRNEKLIEGLLIAVVLHALFNIFLEMNLTFMIVPFLVGGYTALKYLFQKKENQKYYKEVVEIS